MNKASIRKALSASVILSLAVSAGCAKSDGGSSATTKPQESPKASPTVAAADPLGKYSPAIDFTMARQVDTSFKFKPNESIENNDWNKLIAEKLGINLKYAWTANNQQYEQKMNVTIASNDLPDLMQVWGTQVTQLAEAGSIADLTEAYNKYASPLLKERMNLDGGIALKTAMVGGKIMAIPEPADTTPGTMLFVRKDWLDKLGLPEPKTMQDVLKISEAFTKKDPDGNGKNDTYGLGLQKDFVKSGTFGLEGFASGFHAYPDAWLPDGKGGLQQTVIQPQMKQALLKLQEMFKDGQIDKEFGVKDSSKINQDVVAGKIGMFYGPFWAPVLPLKDSWAKDKADWRSYEVVSNDGKPAVMPVKPRGQNYFVVKKGVKNPEAAVKMANLYVEMDAKMTDETYGKYFKASIDNGKGGTEVIDVFKYAPIKLPDNEGNISTMKRVQDALKTGDTSKLRPGDDKVSYERLKKWQAGDKSDANGWQDWALMGTGGAFSIQEKNVKDHKINNEYWGPTTETMSKKLSTLNKKREEVFTNIVLGASIDEFDKFVADWKALGGDEITKEVNDWYAKNKK